MPVYQYACTECGEQLEVRQSFTDDALSVCPVCAGRLRKVLSAVGVVFKGSGFYRTDSRSGASAEAAGSSDTPASTPEKAGAGATSTSDSSSSPSDSSESKKGSAKDSTTSTPTAAAS